MATEAQLVARARVIARDQDPDGYDQGGLEAADWLDELNGAHLDFYLEAGIGRAVWTWPLAYQPYNLNLGDTGDDIHVLPSITGIHQIEDLYFGDPREHRGVRLQYTDDPGEILYLQDRRPKVGNPQMAHWRRIEGSLLWELMFWPTPAAIDEAVTNPVLAVDVVQFLQYATALIGTAGAGTFTQVQTGILNGDPSAAGALITTDTAAKLGTLPRAIVGKNANASTIQIYPYAALAAATNPYTLTRIESYPLIVGGHARMYPAVMTGGSTTVPLLPEQFEWVAAIAAARAMALMSDDPQHVQAIASRIDEAYQRLAFVKRGELKGAKP